MADLIADGAEGVEPGMLVSFGGGGIGEGMVDHAGGGGEDGAHVAGVIANGDDPIEGLAGELIDVLGTVMGNIDADFREGGDRLGPHDAGLGAGAFDQEAIAEVMTEQAFGHLAAG